MRLHTLIYVRVRRLPLLKKEIYERGNIQTRNYFGLQMEVAVEYIAIINMDLNKDTVYRSANIYLI